MKPKRSISWATLFIFSLALLSGAYGELGAQTGENENKEISKLLQEADQNYQAGNFKEAIAKYQQVIQLINDKKELAKTKQELFQTMVSLALTYFTIQENEKAAKQLEELIRINPKQELDSEFYPPRFIGLFRQAQQLLLGKLEVTTTPSGAQITVADVRLGQSPLALDKYPAGTFTIQIELPGTKGIRQEITIKANENNVFSFSLDAEKPALEKVAPLPAKDKMTGQKKRFPWLIIGGAAILGGVAVALLAGKKDETKKLVSRTFANTQAMAIEPILPTAMLLNVGGLPTPIEHIEFQAIINHPGHMEDLVVAIVGIDRQTTHVIWNRQQAANSPVVLSGSITVFNSLPPNGTWRLLVQNPGRNGGGIIQSFRLQFFYLE